eukprot:scaffold71204_cov57-Phaeocystis_antarctica.AAC.2
MCAWSAEACLVEDSLPLDPTHGYRRGGSLILAGPFQSFLVMVHHVILKQIRFAQPLLLEHVFWWCLILVDAGRKSVHSYDGGARGANGQPRRQRRVRRAFADRHDCCRFGFWRGRVRRLNITTALTGQSTADRLGSEEDVDLPRQKSIAGWGGTHSHSGDTIASYAHATHMLRT